MIHTLSGTLQHYAWGGNEFIANFLNQKPQKTPWAEYWLGGHPLSPSRLENGLPLDEYLLEQNLELPYLLKILDVKSMLSIQVHPTESQAQIGYEQELAKNIPIAKRIYKDVYAKSEMCVALSDFYLLSGFSPLKDAINQLIPHLSLRPIMEILQQEGQQEIYKTLHTYLIKCDEKSYQAMLIPVIENLKHMQRSGILKEHNPTYWLLRAYQKYPQDRSLLLILVMNLIYLREGQAYYHKEGVLHAYLKGQCVEIMGNSDNVLRAGLTKKPIHIKQLMACTNYEPMDFYLCPVYERNTYERSFVCNSKAFELQQIELPPNVLYTSNSVGLEILLFTEGSGFIEDLTEKRTIPVSRGQALLLLSNTSFALRSFKNLSLFRALPFPTTL